MPYQIDPKFLLFKCQIMMQIYFKCRLVKCICDADIFLKDCWLSAIFLCHNIMQIYFYKDLLAKCHIIVMQIYVCP